MLKSPFKSAMLRPPQQRSAIAIILLEAIIKLGPTLDTMSLGAAYEYCRSTLAKDFEALTLARIARGAFAEASRHYTCDCLLNAVELTNAEEMRDARTIHQAKGTECQNVLVCLHGRNDDDTQTRLTHIFSPSPTSSEEQRITYVAISRARDRLFLATPDLNPEQERRALELGIEVIRLGLR
jgi:DNA helicase-2/ATP-dependent DNA helicase PcrA